MVQLGDGTMWKYSSDLCQLVWMWAQKSNDELRGLVQT